MYKKIIFLFIAFGVFITNVNAVANPYIQNGIYSDVNCTWYAWQMAYEKGGVAMAGFGNAKDWYNDAINAGYSVGSVPKANSIIVWGQWTDLGHVGYVEKIEGDTMYIWDSSRFCSAPNEAYDACIKEDTDKGLLSEGTYKKCDPLRTPVACEYNVNDNLVTGYIYLGEPMQNPPVSNDTPPAANVENPPAPVPEEIIKSSNNYLSELSIDNIEVSFDKNILEYTFEVENNIDEIVITAAPEDNKSVIDGIGTMPLEVGINNFTIKVTAEDGSIKEYKVSVTRKEKVVSKKEPEKNESTPKEDTNKNSNYIYFITAGIIVIIITTLIIIIRLWKKKKNK